MMFANDKSIDNLEQLFKEIKTYILLQKEYVRLELIEKLTILASAIILTMSGIILGMMALFYLSFSIAYIMAPHVGGLTVSFAIITALLLLLFALIFFMRKQLIIRPLLTFITALFTKSDLNDDNNEK